MREERARPSGSRDGRADDDLYRQRQVADDALEDDRLLAVLLAEVGAVGLHQREERGHDRRYAAEVAGPLRSLEHVTKRTRVNDGGGTGRVHLVDAGYEDNIDTQRFQQRKIGLLVARVAAEILVRAELRRVDEDTGHDARACVARAAHQAGMAFVQRAHGRYEAHVRRQRRARLPHLRARPCYVHDEYSLLVNTLPVICMV